MALDLYVGTLTRYYLGEWENLGQRAARLHGMEYRVIAPEGPIDEPEDAITDPAAIRTAINDWREVMVEGLAGNLKEPLEWDESEEAPHFTNRPTWEGYAALMLLAAYEEHPEHDPPTMLPDNWSEDPVLALSRSDEFATTEYLQILSAELWLPGEFPFTFRFLELTGRELCIGSTDALLRELELLNERTFKGESWQLREWRSTPPDDLSPFDVAARFGLATFMELAAEAVANRLPLKMDY